MNAVKKELAKELSASAVSGPTARPSGSSDARPRSEAPGAEREGGD